MGSQGKHRYMSELAELDWDFPGQNVETGFAKFHWHPARFIPQLPAIAIGSLSKEGERVLDPFCGSGTTLVEARLQGRNALGIDTNPAATMITAAKVAAFNAVEFDRYMSILLRSVDRVLGSSGSQLPLECNTVPNFDEQRRWYHERTLAELSAIWCAIQDGGSQFQLAASASFSAILRGVCSQTHHWGWICDNVHPKAFIYRDAVSAFGSKLREYGSAATEMTVRMIGKPESLVELGRCSEVLARHPNGSFDLAVTSPPYFGVTDYAKSQRLTFLWFGYPLEESRLSETGARSKRQRRTALKDFMVELDDSFTEIARVLRPKAYCVIVVGESPARAVHLDAFEDLIESRGLRIVERISRRLPRQRGMMATLQNEKVMVCCRE